MRWNAKLVRFLNGKFGVRYGFFFHRFQDFQNTKFTRSSSSVFMADCKTDEERARAWMIKGYYEVVK